MQLLFNILNYFLDDTESLPMEPPTPPIKPIEPEPRNVTGYLMGIMILGLLFAVATLCSIKIYIKYRKIGMRI